MNIKAIYKQGICITKDILFPAYCLGCGKEGILVCKDCLQTLDCSGVFCCPVCHASSLNGKVCEICMAQSYLDRHVAITQYKEKGLVGDMLHMFKYSYVEDMAQILRDMAIKFSQVYSFDVDIVVCVPLHRRRLAQRGFNQAEEIARISSQVFDIPFHSILRRCRHTRQQAKLNREGRLVNLIDAFEIIKNDFDLNNKRVLLVDDVLTTGSTMQECAKVLKGAGAKEVIGF